MEKYEFVAGLEMHVQLNTLTKAFCADKNQFGHEPNTMISSISLAHPGTLPVINENQIEKAIKLGLALSSSISPVVIFDRKNYTYPDLPKGYQLTQDTQPICVGGEIYLPTSDRVIRLHHIHMEEDAGKSIHDMDPHFTCIDLNRAGVPLLEVVTEPDFKSPDEVSEFIEIMQKLVVFLGISDGQMEEGSIRCDCNVSIRPIGSDILNERCEIKNINSKRFAKIATEYEFERQVKLVESGQTVRQQTLHFDKQKKTTYPMRAKEEAHDYRYLPDPDLPPILISPEWINEIRDSIGILPWDEEEKLLNTYKLSVAEARAIAYDHDRMDYVESICAQIAPDNFKAFFDIYFQKISKIESRKEIPKEEYVVEFIRLLKTNKINKVQAYGILFDEMIRKPDQSPEELARYLDILHEEDLDFVHQVVHEVFTNHPKEVDRFFKGDKKLMGFFIGQAMKISQGKAPAQEIRKAIQDKFS